MNPLLAERHVCHVLLLETSNGLVLVDTGFGRDDNADPRRRVGPIRHVIKPKLADEDTAVAQIAAMGMDTSDVRHIVATHLDLDHIGGVSDFPNAQLHTTAAEAESAYSSSLRSRIRYNRAQLPTDLTRVTAHQPGGETWRGLAHARPLTSIDPDIVLIPLPGHTVGHAAIAVNAGHRWVLHCGDAFHHRHSIDPTARAPLTSRLFERLSADDVVAARDNLARLTELSTENDPNLLIVCAHDQQLLHAAQQTA